MLQINPGLFRSANWRNASAEAARLWIDALRLLAREAAPDSPLRLTRDRLSYTISAPLFRAARKELCCAGVIRRVYNGKTGKVLRDFYTMPGA